jgi:hypothetical protein
MITPPMPRVGSIQKNVLLMPPQLRLPGERLPATWSAVMRKPSPHLSRPSAMKVKSALRGSALLSAGTEIAPM